MNGLPDRTLYANDCLNVLSDKLAIDTESVDLIYLDPPFNSKSDYNLPFKKKHKSKTRPVAVFTDTWTWGDEQERRYEEFRDGVNTQPIAKVIDVARHLEGPTTKYRLDAYLVNMAARLIEMRRVLKPTGSIYLHCDPTASHYLKAVMDVVFGRENFRNEIVWCYREGINARKNWNKKHDTILFYSKTDTWTFNPDAVLQPHSESTVKKYIHEDGKGKYRLMGRGIAGSPVQSKRDISSKWEETHPELVYRQYLRGGTYAVDYWLIDIINQNSRERLGYPTQKPLKLLRRIIKASSNPGDVVLDPFCGCGTTIHAAQELSRRWIGIDIARFSVGLVRNRLLSNFKHKIGSSDIRILGIPETVADARDLATQDKFEFEKWACGAVGAEGMLHEPGRRGADGGVDGVLKFFPHQPHKGFSKELAIVQVKGGKVTPDSVRALYGTVREFEAKAGVMICFKDQMRTVENNRLKETFQTSYSSHPVIQGLSVENLIAGKGPDLPNVMKMAA